MHMGAVPSPHGPSLRLLRLRSGVGLRALARALGRGPSRVASIENSVRVSERVATTYVDAVHGLVRAREAMTIDDVV
jgi:hypothetical protein